MNIQKLRHGLKVKWLLYYRQNRPWITKLRVWGTYDGKRRPASSFILAALTNTEPELVQMLPFIVNLSNNPDQIVAALGLNFNPEEELKSLTESTVAILTNTNGNGMLPASSVVETNTNGNGNGNGVSKRPPKTNNGVNSSPINGASTLPSWVDESCKGVGWNRSNAEALESSH